MAALSVALGMLGLLRSRQQPRFSWMACPLSDADYVELAARPGWRAHGLSAAPGVTLRGLVREPATPTDPWILFFGGNSGQVLREGQQVLEALCAERGWGAATWAYRGFDSSGGGPDPAALHDDGLKAYLDLLAERRFQPQSVHLAGFSLGTSIAASVAARTHPQAPASLILLAPLTRIYVGGRRQLRLHRFETTRWLAGIASPVLVIHGVDDAALGIEGARMVAGALGARAVLLELPGIGHADLPLSAPAQQAMRAFIDQHPGRPGGHP